MATIAKRTISLSGEHDTYIKRKLRSGDFASASEIVRAGIRALQERDAAIERWLHAEVAPTYDAMTENPGRAVSIKDAFMSIRSRKKHA
jgi:antitoxin ParD1/3/4